MKDWLFTVSEYAILMIDTMALIVIVFGTVEAFIKSLALAFTQSTAPQRQDVWLRFARWLVAGLTFQLAADIVETSITTTWESLGRIAVIAVIRTFLNFFLDRDVKEINQRQRDATTA